VWAEDAFCEPPDLISKGVAVGATQNPTTHFRHAGKASVAWCDGHVSAEGMAFTKGGWGGRGLGFLAAESYLPVSTVARQPPEAVK
jgi:prepilin-type processing-associated H-X9-DG protein